jgi:DSF synthase
METFCRIERDDPPPFTLPSYSQLICQYDPERHAFWYYLSPRPRPCSTLTLAKEVCDLQQRVADELAKSEELRERVQYLVVASATPKVFNLGGDLEHFVRLVSAQDRKGLYEYARLAIDVVYRNWTHLGIPTLTTISLVQGTALGGGFEGAISSNVVIAEESAQMGFPEILFNLFPGMGGYSLLTRRIEPARAERLLRSGRQHTARELWEMGVVDVLAPDGEGVHAVNDFIRRRRASRNGLMAIQRARQYVTPLTYQELLEVVSIWVEAAMDLSERDLRVMTQLAAAQLRPLEFENKTKSPATMPKVAPVHELAPTVATVG